MATNIKIENNVVLELPTERPLPIGAVYKVRQSDGELLTYTIDSSGEPVLERGITNDQKNRLDQLTQPQITKLAGLKTQSEIDQSIATKVSVESGKSLVSDMEIVKLTELDTQSELDEKIATATANATSSLIPVIGTVLPRGVGVPSYITTKGKAELLGGNDEGGTTFTNTGTTPSSFNVPKGSVGYAYYDKATDSWSLGSSVEMPSTPVIDNVASESSIDALSAKQGKVLNERIQGVDSNVNISKGYANLSSITIFGTKGTGFWSVGDGNAWQYVPTIGDPLPSPTVNGIAYSVIIPVKTGDRVGLKTRGGDTARAWALMDSDGLVYSMAPNSTSYIDPEFIIIVPQNGRLLVQWFTVSLEPTSDTFYLKNAPLVAIDNTNSPVSNTDTKLYGNYFSLIGFYRIRTSGTITPSTQGAVTTSLIPFKKGDTIVADFLASTPNYNNYVLYNQYGQGIFHPSINTGSINLNSDNTPEDCAFIGLNSNESLYTKSTITLNGRKTILDLQKEISSIGSTPIRIAVIGNSFSRNGPTYFPSISRSFGKNVVIEVIGNEGQGLQSNYNAAINDTVCNIHQKYDNRIDTSWQVIANTTIKTMLENNDFDVIILHQQSLSSSDYTTYQPYLHNLIDFCKIHSRNENIKFGLQLTWAYGDGYNYPQGDLSSQIDFYEKNAVAYQQAAEDEKIDIIIPAGTAIQNGRSNALLKSAYTDFVPTTDFVHLNSYGSFLSSLTWFAILIGRELQISITDYTGNPLSISDENMKLFKKAAKLAVKRPYDISQV